MTGFFAQFYDTIEHGRGILFEGGTYAGVVFIVLTLLLGGSMAWSAGRAIALTWRPLWLVPVYMLALSAMVRFLHYALFQENLASPAYFAVTFAILLALALWGYRSMRVAQMLRQYSWAFARSGFLGWRAKA